MLTVGQERAWWVVDVQHSETWSACEAPGCGHSVKRAIILRHAETGERLVVGRTCAQRLVEIPLAHPEKD